MSSERGLRIQRQPEKPSNISTVVWWVVGLFAILIPLFCQPSGYNAFRLPKEVLLRAEAILIVASFATVCLRDGLRSFVEVLPPRPVWLLLIAIALWSVIALAFSTNRPLSLIALGYTAAAIIVFLGSFAAFRLRRLQPVMSVVLIGAVPNAILAVSQATSLWNPFRFDATLSAHLRTSALIGNANDVGAYLMPLVLMTCVAAIATRRWWWWVVAAILMAGLVASQSLTAMIALGGGIAALILMLPGRNRSLRLAVMILLVGLAVAVIPPLRVRAGNLRRAWVSSDYSALTSQRIFPIVTAWSMFADRPLTGLGPGTFKFHYLGYRKIVDQRHPSWYLTNVENFGEVHSDHLQILSEEGLPGYVLFLASLLAIGSLSLKQVDAQQGGAVDPRGTFVRLGALPFAASFAILTESGFPLEVAAATQVALHVAAALLGWSGLHEAA